MLVRLCLNHSYAKHTVSFLSLDMETLSVKFAVGLWVIQDFAGLFNRLEGDINAIKLGWMMPSCQVSAHHYIKSRKLKGLTSTTCRTCLSDDWRLCSNSVLVEGSKLGACSSCMHHMHPGTGYQTAFVAVT